MSVTRYVNRLSDYFFMAARCVRPAARSASGAPRARVPEGRARRVPGGGSRTRARRPPRFRERTGRLAALEQGKEEVVYQKERKLAQT